MDSKMSVMFKSYQTMLAQLRNKVECEHESIIIASPDILAHVLEESEVFTKNGGDSVREFSQDTVDIIRGQPANIIFVNRDGMADFNLVFGFQKHNLGAIVHELTEDVYKRQHSHNQIRGTAATLPPSR